MNKLKSTYTSPETEVMEVRIEKNMLYSGNGAINNLNDHTYGWDDSDWTDVE